VFPYIPEPLQHCFRVCSRSRCLGTQVSRPSYCVQLHPVVSHAHLLCRLTEVPFQQTVRHALCSFLAFPAKIPKMSYSHEQMTGEVSTFLGWGHIPSFEFREISMSGKSGEDGNFLIVQQPMPNLVPFRNVFEFEMKQRRWICISGDGGIDAFAKLCGVKPLSPLAAEPVVPVVPVLPVDPIPPVRHVAPAEPKLPNSLLPDTSAVDVAAQDDESSCVICMEFQNRVVLVPCGHKCLCISCAKSQSAGYRCPICRVVAKVACVVYN
jgi:hypothetical protein